MTVRSSGSNWRRLALALALLAPLPALASTIGTITVTGAHNFTISGTTTDTFNLVFTSCGVNCFQTDPGFSFSDTYASPAGNQHGFTVAGSLVFQTDGVFGSGPFQLTNYTADTLTYSLSFQSDITAQEYVDAFTSLSGNSTSQTSGFSSSASLVLKAGNPLTDPGTDLNATCIVSASSSATCNNATGNPFVTFPPTSYSKLTLNVTGTVPGNNSVNSFNNGNQVGLNVAFGLDAVPEPSTMFLIGAGFVALALTRKRRPRTEPRP